MIGKLRSSMIALFVGAAPGCGAEGGPELGHAPRSLDGTEVDGRFGFDGEGELVVDEGLQRTFDYFLTADGELSPAELDAWMAELVRSELGDGQAHEQVMDAWRSYRMFRAKTAAVLEDPSVDLEQAERHLLAALALQLGDTPLARAERRRIERGFALQRASAIADPHARAAELARLNADEARSFAATRAGRYLAGSKAIALAQQQQASPEIIAALREQHFDPIAPGATARLATLDAKRAAWQQRVDDFRAAREQLQQRYAGRQAELDAAVAALEAEHFSDAERRRVRALERMAAAE